MAGRWLDVGEAARELGISTDAVRKRIARGSLRSERTDEGVRVWRDDGGTTAGHEDEVEGGALVEEMRSRVAYLEAQVEAEREARRRADTLLAQALQANAALVARVPELEAAQEHSAPAEEAAEGAVGVRVGQGDTGAQEGVQRPWYRRWFGG